MECFEADPPPKLNNKQLTEVRERMYEAITNAFYEGWDKYYKEDDLADLDPSNDGEDADDEDIGGYNS